MSYSGRPTVDMMILKMSQLSAFAGLFEWNALFVDPWIHTTIFLSSFHITCVQISSRFIQYFKRKRNKRTIFSIFNIST